LKTGIAPTLREIEEARVRIERSAYETPVYVSESFGRMTGREIWLKAENLQRTGSFKIRGAGNCIAMLSEEERAAGVVAASAGNHAQAVAWAAREAGLDATIFMPADTPVAKVEATQNYGARIQLGGEMFDEAYEAARRYADNAGATFVHPFEDERVIAGQGTIGLELVEQLPQLGTVVVPIGGGGLAAGIATAVKEVRPDVHVVGVQAAACAPFAGRDTHEFTIAEGIAVKKPGVLTRAIVEDKTDEIVTVTDEEISKAIVLLLERAKLVVEGAGAASLAALLAGKVGGSGPVAIVLSGGNIDPTLLISVMRHGLTLAGRYLVLRTRVPDRPGELVKLLTLIAEERVNVLSVEHHREGMQVSVAETEIELVLATRDETHREALVETMQAWGYPVERLR
jgi:threonine dehydratase